LGDGSGFLLGETTVGEIGRVLNDERRRDTQISRQARESCDSDSDPPS
jgi:hypothetical protein